MRRAPHVRARRRRLRHPHPLGHGALRRPAHRRHRPAPRLHRRNGHGRRQDPRRHPPRLPQRPHRPRRPRRHRQRLPRAPRLHVDGRPLQLPRPERRLHPEHDAQRPAPQAVRLRHHLRHQRRIRLRLPARQRHGHLEGKPGAARPLLRHHRRSGLHPHRRSTHPAHHLRPRRHRERAAV